MTISDIAKKLGVSESTVSRAISGKGRIGEETREKVLACIRENNYKPNPMAQALASSRTFNIAVVIPKNPDGAEVPFFQECLVDIAEVASERGYDSVVATETADDISVLERLVANRKVDGVVVTRLLKDDRTLNLLRSSGIPFVVIGSCDEDVYQIDSSQEEGCYELTQKLLDNGCCDMVLLAGGENQTVNMRRYNGFRRAYVSKKPEAVPYVKWNLDRAADVIHCMPEIMEKKPECIVCMDDVICSPVLAWLKQNGYSIPQDVDVVSFYDSQELQQYSPSITAVYVDEKELCRQACDTLLNLIAGKNVSLRTMLGYELKIRKSCKVIHS